MAAKLSLVSSPMTAADAAKSFTAFRDMVGPKADVYVSLNTSRYGRETEPLSMSLYNRGSTMDKLLFRVDASTFDGLLSAAQAKWAEHEDQYAIDTIKAMALDIIRITDERGHCSDADLRAGAFVDDEVIRFGEQACAKAAEMAAKGPFSIVALGGSNCVGAA